MQQPINLCNTDSNAKSLTAFGSHNSTSSYAGSATLFPSPSEETDTYRSQVSPPPPKRWFITRWGKYLPANISPSGRTCNMVPQTPQPVAHEYLTAHSPGLSGCILKWIWHTRVLDILLRSFDPWYTGVTLPFPHAPHPHPQPQHLFSFCTESDPWWFFVQFPPSYTGLSNMLMGHALRLLAKLAA